MRRGLKWTAAILASGVLHAGAAAWMLREAPAEVLIEGSATMEIALLGSLEDAISAGEDIEPDVADPVPETTETIAPRPIEQPVEPARTARADTAQPSRPAEVVAAETVEAAPSPVVEALEPDLTLPAQVNLPAETLEPAQTSEPVEVAAARAVSVESAAPPVETTTAEATPVEPASQPAEIEPEIAESPKEPEPVREIETALAVAPPEAVEPDETAAAVADIPLPADAPLPRARPEPPVVREGAVRAKLDESRAQRRPEPKRPSGSGGRQDRDSRKGQADGGERGNASASGAGRGAGQAGNAAVSNYPGQVASKLRRAVRNVPRSARSGARRDVHVAFVVTADGGLGSVRIGQSSGSPELDQAALDSVRRAAPFPPIPAGAGKSSWSFSVPLGLAR